MKILPCQEQVIYEILQKLSDLTNNAIIITVCAGCRELQGFKDGKGVYGISHGLCLPCNNKLRRDAGLPEIKPKTTSQLLDDCSREIDRANEILKT